MRRRQRWKDWRGGGREMPRGWQPPTTVKSTFACWVLFTSRNSWLRSSHYTPEKSCRFSEAILQRDVAACRKSMPQTALASLSFEFQALLKIKTTYSPLTLPLSNCIISCKISKCCCVALTQDCKHSCSLFRWVPGFLSASALTRELVTSETRN